MTHPEESSVAQLKEACRIARARWVVWIHHVESGWFFGTRHGLTQPRQAALTALIGQENAAAWLAGTFSSGRVRSRHISSPADELGCERLYVFPNLTARAALLVGAAQLDKGAENIFKVLALSAPTAGPANPFEGQLHEGILFLPPVEAGLEMSYNPESVLENVLEFLAGTVHCEAALMSVRFGEVFRIQAVWNCPAALRGTNLSIKEDWAIAEVVETRQGLILSDLELIKNDRAYQALSTALNQPSQSMLSVPVVVGQRVIGHLAFASTNANAFDQADLALITQQARRLAYVVENAIMFAEAARYLQQLALLNELASAASLGLDTHEVSRRVMLRLHRAFQTAKAGVFLLSSDGRMLREYGVGTMDGAPLNIPVAGSLIGYVVETGLPLRIGAELEIPGRTRYLTKTEETSSELVVPLKYRGHVIGALALARSIANAFTQQDEQLLVVIASHLAGLFENMRLNDEARERAHNLNLIHQVVRRVVGLTQLDEIAQVTADLMVRRFSYESALVVLSDAHNQSLLVRGSGLDKDGEDLAGFKGIGRMGIVQRVIDNGVTCLIGDISSDPAYAGLASPRPGSEMCVPLREGDRIFGAVDVGRSHPDAFSESDLLALEALAGVISSVVLSTRRYLQLQDSVRQLQAVRETALDIAADLELDALLKRVVHRARELVGARGAELGFLDEKEGVVRILVAETPWESLHDTRIPLSLGVAGRVAATSKPLVVDDYNSWSGRLFPDKETPFKAVAGVPLVHQGQVIGTLTVLDDRPDWRFRAEHVQLLELFAPQVTVWIHNARLYQELQERIEAQQVAENRLIRSARLAAVGEMAAGVAHELNNPLTTVAGFVELVLEELPVDSLHRTDLELVLREAHRARGVVRRLLDFSRPVENLRTHTDLNELVNDVLMLVHHLARTGGVEIRSEMWEEGSRLPWISADPNQIKQVLLNLLHNGIQAMPRGGLLQVRTGLRENPSPDGSEPRKWVTVSVQDSGDGIPPENLERIFEPFFTTRPAGTGTGLGLSVSYGIVNEHGGFIEVDSRVGGGSCFTVFMPVESDLPHD